MKKKTAKKMSSNEFTNPDRFTNADEYIIYQLTDNKGGRNCISRQTLITLAKEYGINFITTISKKELAEAVYKAMGKDIIEYCEHIGIPAYAFMCKYRLLPEEITEFTKAGLLEITGTLKIYENGKEKIANLYSPYQYYCLNDIKISEWREKVYGKGA